MMDGFQANDMKQKKVLKIRKLQYRIYLFLGLIKLYNYSITYIINF